VDYLPLFHNLKQRRVIVIGGGEIALRKIRLVAEAGASITAVAIEFCDELRAMAAESETLQLLENRYSQAHMHNLQPAYW
jgi:uroporphyrin-III C-methyltransferase/precorrin-2 dehydrogenase/sirohydrochlorin ferrochelatase